MKAITKALMLVMFAVFCGVSCEKTPDAPPFNKPEYNGPDANITIADLRSQYAADLAGGGPVTIEYEYILKAVVIANDESGNIYKQLYIRDNTGAINIGIDQNSMYTDYRVGQTIYLNLHELSLVVYGDQVQIGYEGTNANRIPWEIFEAKASKDDFPNEANAQPEVMTFSEISADDVNKLVRFNQIYFLEGGQATFATTGGYGERYISDGTSTQIMVRTSNYSNFATDILPEGGGDIIAILGRYGTTWQLLLRDTGDLLNFGGPIPGDGGGTDPGPGPDPGDGTVVFEETFGPTWRTNETTTLTKTWAEYTAEDRFDMKAPIVYSTSSDPVDFRNTNSYNNPHVWFAANYDKSLTISGIPGYSNAQLQYDIACNLSGGGAPIAGIMVRCDGVDVTVPTGNLGAQNDFTTITIDIPDNTTVIEFYSTPTSNPSGNGYRLDNIKIVVDGDGGGTTPPPTGNETQFFKETFGATWRTTETTTLTKTWAEFTAEDRFDMKAPVVYSTGSDPVDFRNTNSYNNPHIWIAANYDKSFKIEGIASTGYTGLTLSYDLAANSEGASYQGVLVKCNNVDVTVPSGTFAAYNSFTTITISIPDGTTSVEFYATPASNTVGYRLDNIVISGTAQ